ncbi:MAG: TCR/Tet family MFS transporter [Devosiaceae bacterium]
MTNANAYDTPPTPPHKGDASKPAGDRRALTFILITVVLDVIGLGIIIPVLPQLIADVAGASAGGSPVSLSEAASIGGWLMFAYAFMQFLAAPVLGNLADAHGRRPILLCGLAILAMDYLIMALAPTLLWLFIGRTMAGMAAATFTTAFAYIADITPKENRAARFGLVGAAFGVGFIIGPAIGGVLGAIDVRLPFFAASALCIINLLFGLFVLPESLPKSRRRTFDIRRANPVGTLISFLPIKPVLYLILAYACLELALQVYPVIWAYFTPVQYGWSTAQVGLSLAFFGFLICLGEGVLIRIVLRWFGEHGVVIGASVLTIATMLLFSVISSTWGAYAVMVFAGVSGIGTTAIQALASGAVDESRQGEVTGAITSAKSMVFFIAPPIMTGLFALFTRPENPLPNLPGAPFVFAAAVAALMFVPYFNARKLGISDSAEQRGDA